MKGLGRSTATYGEIYICLNPLVTLLILLTDVFGHQTKEHINMVPIIILVAFLSILFHFFRRRQATTANLPPSPPGLPVLGNLHQLTSLPHQSLHSLSKKYGPIILLRFGAAPTAIISSAEMAEQVMKAKDLIFSSRPPSSMADRLLYNSTDIAFSPYNEYWRRMKMISTVHLLSRARVMSFSHVREEEVALLLADIRSASPSSPVNLSQRLVTLTNDIICRVALGRKCSRDMKFNELLIESIGLLGTFPLRDFIPWLGWVDALSGLDERVRRTSKGLDEFLEQVIEEHLSAKISKTAAGVGGNVGKEGVDFIDVLLSLRDDDQADAAVPIGRDQLKAVILDMFAAGTDTTFTALEWAMAELIRKPALMQDVQREIRDVVGTKGVVVEEDIDRMTYLKALIKETLRMHPPVPLLVSRVATEDTQLQGYDIAAGTRIMINAWTISRDPNYWDRPEEFLPERFINSNVDFRGQHFQLTPFGAGRRVCPGISFAIASIECTLANLLHHFDWAVPEEMKDEVLDMSESPGITTHKKSALILTPKLHSAAFGVPFKLTCA